MQLNWDIFCRVVDNYGDIGVCWRLARQLAVEHGKRVRLWVDDLSCLQPLCPAVDATLDRQQCQAVEIVRWPEDSVVDRMGEVVIEAFACELPVPYLKAMAAATPKPCWINLEYLSAESWVESCHGMASPHPSLPLVKHFFFPGFSAGTGGLLREADLLARRDREAALPRATSGIDISLFCYDTAPVGDLLDLLAESPTEVRLHVAPGKPQASVAAHLGTRGPWQRGMLSVRPFDFLPQDEFDSLLWHCDINFVRGEDSFIRAQWAGKPFIWQIYQQEEAAHLVKLDAFLARYTAGLDPLTKKAATDLFKTWNSGGDLKAAWDGYLQNRPEIARHNRDWAVRLAENPTLAESLVKFCAAKV